MPLEPESKTPTLEQLQALIPDDAQSELPSTPKSIDTSIDFRHPSTLQDAQVAAFTLRLIEAYARRLKDALALYLPLATAADYHACRDVVRLVSGSNQAGKTLTICMELARVMRDMDPHKKRNCRNLKIVLVGKDGDHLADPLYFKLCMPGAFDIITDDETGLWRSVRVDPQNPRQIDPADMARKTQWQPAPPLLPPWEVDDNDIAWEKRRENIPSMIPLKRTGNILRLYSSKAYPRQGVQLDWGIFDEEIENEKWFKEMLPRLLRREGWFDWGATPQASTHQFFELHKKVLANEPGFSEFHLSLEDNAYISEAAKLHLYNLYKHDPSELAVRYFGRYAILERRAYPTYDPNVHMVQPFDPPADWMLLAIIDPGTLKSGAVFLAIPPDGDEVHVHAELFLKNADAHEFAREFKKIHGGRYFTAFVIDKRGSQQTPMGYSNRVCDQYREAFVQAGIEIPGGDFKFGSDQVEGRILSLKKWLYHDAESGTKPILRLHRGATVNLDRQIQGRYYDKTDSQKLEKRSVHELVDCLEYGAAWFDGRDSLYYDVPPEIRTETSDQKLVEAVLKKQAREKRRTSRGGSFSLGHRSDGWVG